jgi:hypothetical protein
VMGHPPLQSSSTGTSSAGSPFSHTVVIQPTAAAAPQAGHFVQVIRSLTVSPCGHENSPAPCQYETTEF